MEIKYNTEIHRWEVFGENPVIRAGEPQPVFVSADVLKCIKYRKAVESRD